MALRGRGHSRMRNARMMGWMDDRGKVRAHATKQGLLGLLGVIA